MVLDVNLVPVWANHDLEQLVSAPTRSALAVSSSGECIRMSDSVLLYRSLVSLSCSNFASSAALFPARTAPSRFRNIFFVLLSLPFLEYAFYRMFPRDELGYPRDEGLDMLVGCSSFAS